MDFGGILALLILVVWVTLMLAGLRAASPLWRSGDQERLRQRLQRHLAEAQLDERSGRVEGLLQSWPARLKLKDARDQRHPFELQLDLPHAPPFSLRIRRTDALGWLQARLGAWRDIPVSGGSDFDREHLVEATGAGAVEPLTRTDVQEQVALLLGLSGVDELRIEGGVLTVRGALPRSFGKRPIERLFAAIMALARNYDRRPAVDLDLHTRFVWTGGSENARCPYCHDDLGRSALVACDACGTLLHGECQLENGGCPILGCGETGSTAARVKA